jgi:polysaccharide pyruvyl transferase WcaK-like protein
MDTITIVDTSICSDNLGDEIIMDAVNKTVMSLFPDAYIFRTPSHESLSDRTRKFIEQSSFCFLGGTNLIQSDLRPDGIWRFHPMDARVYAGAHTVCLGVGWKDYMPSATEKTNRLLHTALSPYLLHAVRDNYTREHLITAGVKTISTSCPTTWDLTPAHCSTIPAARAPSVVFTLTAWRPAPEDREWIAVLKRHYLKLYFFPQMQDDFEYFQSFGLEDVEVIPPSTVKYTRFLQNEDVDFVGTRLHGGIRALQMGRRALILAVDNRAAEISKDISLPVIERSDVAAIEAWIEGGAATVLNLPQDEITAFKAQFSAPNIKLLPQPTSPLPELWRSSLKVAKSAVKMAIGRH